MIKNVTVKTLQKFKDNKEKISMLTAYDYSTAKYIDEAGVDIVLVGDSLAMVILGYENTNSIGIEEMQIFTKAVSKGVSRAMVVADMPFLSTVDINTAVYNAGSLIKAGASAVKIEGGNDYIIEIIRKCVYSGIPVMGHLGFTPQSSNVFGGFVVQGKTDEAVESILIEAKKLEQAGVFSIVLEMIPEQSAKYITENLSIPTISCGAGRYCDGQVVVSDDMFGKYSDFCPKFVRRYGNMKDLILNCAKQYNDDVKNCKFPNENEIY